MRHCSSHNLACTPRLTAGSARQHTLITRVVLSRLSRGLRMGALACMLGTSLNTFSVAARADEFATIPKGDAIYTHLTTLRQGPWGSDSNAPAHDLTRYEVAIETARALLKVNAGRNTNPAPSKDTVRALRWLTEYLRPELSRLDVNVPTTQRQLDEMLKTAPAGVRAGTPTMAVPPLVSSTAPNLKGGLNRAASVAVSQRLRVYGALSAVARVVNDPDKNEMPFAPRRAATLARPGSLGAAVSNSSAIVGTLPKNDLIGGTALGGSLGLTNWMQVRARYEQSRLMPGTVDGNFTLQAPMLSGAREAHSVGTGVDISVLPGVKVTGDVARVTALGVLGDSAQRGTRYGGGLNFTGLQNRLSLSANLSRLLPEDSKLLPSTAAEFNLGADVTNWLSLNLRYQEMFSAQNASHSDRLVSGGISVKF